MRLLPLLLLLSCGLYPAPEAPDAGTGCATDIGLPVPWLDAGTQRCDFADAFIGNTILSYRRHTAYDLDEMGAALASCSLVEDDTLPSDRMAETRGFPDGPCVIAVRSTCHGCIAHEAGHVFQWRIDHVNDPGHVLWADAGLTAAEHDVPGVMP